MFRTILSLALVTVSAQIASAQSVPAQIVVAQAADPAPRSVDERLQVTLFAEQPQLATPTGIDVDHRGRVWVIESNTHFRPEDYTGHPTDRLLILQDTTGDGQADTSKTFADGFTHAMSVAVRPAWLPPVQVAEPSADHDTTQVYVATRREIVLLEDLDGDDTADRRTVLVHLETPGDYPHNGLAGFAFHPLGWLYFGFGENLGADYRIIGRDETTLSGGGEGGNIYRVRPDGTELAYWATGFWNPHASCFDGFGRLFTVDNDPDSRPPCRLLHIIEGGDYGYRFRNGRKGLHPFTSWNGEVPGTLPMVAGTGEAPSGILAYEHDAFPEEYLGNLLSTSWGDHRIERFRLRPKGASFESVAEPLIVGGENFRPVGIAIAPDGSLYCSDWVLRDYKLHGKGRIWRISAVDAESPATDSDTASSELPSARLIVRRQAAERMAQSPSGRKELVTTITNTELPTRTRLEALWAVGRLPLDTESIRLLERPPVFHALFTHFDEVTEAVATLTDAPQISFIKDERDIDSSDYASLFFRETDPTARMRQLMTLVRRTPAALKMKTVGANLAGVSYLLAMQMGDEFTAAAAIHEMAAAPVFSDYRELKGDHNGLEVARWVVLRRRVQPDDEAFLRDVLKHESPLVRRIAVQWAAEEHLTGLLPDVEAVLRQQPMTADLFVATLAAIEMLKGRSPAEFDKTPLSEYVVPLLIDDDTPAVIKTQALRMVDRYDDTLTEEVLIALADTDDSELRREAVRTLAQFGGRQAYAYFTNLVRQPPADPDSDDAILFGDALLGMAYALQSPDAQKAAKAALLELLTNSPQPATGADADYALAVMRSLRGIAAEDDEVRKAIEHYARPVLSDPTLEGPQPAEVYQQAELALGSDRLAEDLRKYQHDLGKPGANEHWRQALSETDSDDRALGGPVARGRTVFFHPQGPGCYKCHRVNGRGGSVGPDLSRIGAALTREKLIDSILEPSREIAPQYTSWAMLTIEGKVFTGMIVHENQGTTILGHDDGRTTTLKTLDIEERVPQSKSIMPEKLTAQMTVREFRDLLDYLTALRE